MKDQQHNDLERRLYEAAPQRQVVPDVQDWLSCHGDEVEVLQQQGALIASQKGSAAWRWARVAAAIAMLLGLGFLAGRVSSLRHDLDSMQVQWEQSLQQNSETLRADILTQLHQDVESLAEQTLAASQEATDQRLDNLIDLIEEVRQRDRSQVVAALEQIQRERYRDRIELSNGLQALAVRSLESQDTQTN